MQVDYPLPELDPRFTGEVQAAEFLRELWRVLPENSTGNTIIGLTRNVQYIEYATNAVQETTKSKWLWTSDKSRPDSMAALLEWANTYNNNPDDTVKGMGSIWYNGASRKHVVMSRGDKARGSSDELAHVGALWADIDTVKAGISIESAVKVALAMQLPPNFIVFSGGGIQLVHLLSEPWYIGTRESARQYAAYSKAFYKELRVSSILGDAVDTKVHDAARMMRLPGYVNRKLSRKGARACILYANVDPDARYSIDDIISYATPNLPPKREKITVTKPENGYIIGRSFLSHIVQNNPLADGERHNTLVKIAVEAALGGIPRDNLESLILSKLDVWQINDPAFGSKLDSILEWAYTRDYDNDNDDTGNDNTDELDNPSNSMGLNTIQITKGIDSYLIEMDTESGQFKQVFDSELALHTSKLITLSGDDLPLDITSPDNRSLEFIRDELSKVIQAYIDKELEPRLGTGLLIRVPPGAGKTRNLVHVARNQALQYKQNDIDTANEVNKGRVAFLTQFKMNVNQGKEWLSGFDITDKKEQDLFYFFEARNNDPSSPGYCQFNDIADAVAQKGRNVIATVCANCPAQIQILCKSRYYLSQFTAAESAPVLVARHSHGMISELADQRKIIIMDESPLPTVESGMLVNASDLSLNNIPDYVKDLYPDEVDIVGNVLQWLEIALLRYANQPMEYNITDDGTTSTDTRLQRLMDNSKMLETSLGGRWLFDKILEIATKSGLTSLTALAELTRFTQIPESTIKAISQVNLHGNDLAILKDLPKYALPTLHHILQYELPIFKAGALRWNSRLILARNGLYMHPMNRFDFQQNTKVIIADATGLYDLYPFAFSDKAGKPRQIIPYVRKVEPRGKVIQYIGTENTRSAFRGTTNDTAYNAMLDKHIKSIKGKGKDNKWALENTLALSKEIKDNGNTALSRVITLIHTLSVEHDGSLLVVLYKALSGDIDNTGFIRYFVEKTKILNPDYVQWFGNLRGRNDYKDLDATLIVGTPRIPESALFTQVQIWHWQDPEPLQFERLNRVLPYAYTETDPNTGVITGKGYPYQGYKDERVNAIYLHLIQAELVQCYERIRLNSSNTEKTVYLATAFPCADHVSEFRQWDSVGLELVTQLVFESAINDPEFAKTGTIRKSELIAKTVANAHVSEKTARNAVESEYIARWGSTLEETYTATDAGKAASYKSKNMDKNTDTNTSKLEQVLAWLKANPTNSRLSIKESLFQLAETGLTVSRAQLFRAKLFLNGRVIIDK